MNEDDRTGGPSQRTAPYEGGSAPAGVEPPLAPPAPEFDRRVRFQRLRVAGLLMIAAPPLLALFGVFGTVSRTATASSEALEVSVQYPVTQRFKIRAPLRITVTNVGEVVLPGVELSLLAPYVFAFSDVAMTPGPDRVLDDAFIFEFDDLEPGESRLLAMEMQAQRYWRTEGRVSWREFDAGGSAGGSGVVEFSSLIWP